MMERKLDTALKPITALYWKIKASNMSESFTLHKGEKLFVIYYYRGESSGMENGVISDCAIHEQRLSREFKRLEITPSKELVPGDEEEFLVRMRAI